MAVPREELVPTMAALAPVTVKRGRIRGLALGLAAAGWTGMAAMWATGSAELFGHDQQGTPALASLTLFLIGWLVMIAAMMLPSSLQTLRTLDGAPRTAVGDAPATTLMVGYFAAWAVFGVVAFAGDGVLHRAVDLFPWLVERPSMLVGGVAILAGAAELIGRTPPERTPKVAPGEGWFTVGKRHAVDRIRRCWPLMLFAMALGMSNPAWMMGLTGLMTLELRPRAQVGLRLAGLGLVTMGLAVIAEPTLAPVLFGVDGRP
jgi:predicted metal-binding membrane protein